VWHYRHAIRQPASGAGGDHTAAIGTLCHMASVLGVETPVQTGHRITPLPTSSTPAKPTQKGQVHGLTPFLFRNMATTVTSAIPLSADSAIGVYRSKLTALRFTGL
jgi:hypothetical protein